MSTTFSIDDRSTVEGDAQPVEEDSIVYSRNVTLTTPRLRSPRLRHTRPNPNAPTPARLCLHPVQPGNDEQTALRCREYLDCITTLPAEAVQVSVESGWVTLKGLVRRGAERDTAADVVRYVEGVVGVRNDIDVA